jgi:ABC-type sugar transport system substrate-binding protein
MKSIKATCLLVAALALLAVPAVQAHAQRVLPAGTVHDTSAPPFPPEAN